MTELPTPLAAALAFRYRLERELGSGGMATVWLAHDLKHDRDVALKVLRPELAVSLGTERFLAEIRTTARLQHPHIVALFDSGEAAGFLYYVMPCIEGESLRTRLDREKRLDVDAMLAIARPVAQALAYAHDVGIVHRDIKPENILLSRGQPFVTDFGVARAVSVAGGAHLTTTGVVLGTPAYMSPEQVLGEEGVDARSDVYSLGCVIYEMLSGSPPFTASTVQALLAKRLTGPPPHLPDVPAPVAEVVRRSLATAPQDRFVTAIALVDALVEAARRPAVLEKTLVVLPFENLSPDPDNAFFADGLTEELIAALSKIRALRVTSRTSAMHYKGTTKPLPEITRELNVRYALEGSVRHAANSLRITAQLIDAKTDAHLWAETYRGTLEDVFGIQESVARAIADGLKVTLDARTSARLAERPIQDARAYEAWLRAREAALGFTVDGLRRAFDLTDHSLSIVGDNALLYATQSWLHMISYSHLRQPSGDALARAEELATRALALDPELSWALFAAGAVLLRRGDLQGFVRSARRALEFERDSHTLAGLGTYLAEVGRTDDARCYADEALALDPLTWFKWSARALPDLLDGRFAEAIGRYREALRRLALRDGYPVLALAQALAFAGQEDEAVALFARASADRRSPWSDFGLLFGAALGGNRSGVEAMLVTPDLPRIGKAHGFSGVVIASCLARVGLHLDALEWAERAVAHGFTHHRFLAAHNRFLLPLHAEPRFAALLERARQREQAFQP